MSGKARQRKTPGSPLTEAERTRNYFEQAKRQAGREGDLRFVHTLTPRQRRRIEHKARSGRAS